MEGEGNKKREFSSSWIPGDRVLNRISLFGTLDLMISLVLPVFILLPLMLCLIGESLRDSLTFSATFLLVFATLMIAGIHIKDRTTSNREFLACHWCKGFAAVVVRREIERLLEQNNIPFEDPADRKDQPMLPTTQKGNPALGPDKTIHLPKHHLRIDFWWTVSNFFPIALFHLPNYISVESLKANQSSVPDPFLFSLKTDIEKLFLEMPENNDFCKHCDGKKESSCFGEKRNTWDCWGIFVITTALCLIDPNKDEITRKSLIERKKRLGKQKQNETLEEYFKFIEKDVIEEKFFKIFGVQLQLLKEKGFLKRDFKK